PGPILPYARPPASCGMHWDMVRARMLRNQSRLALVHAARARLAWRRSATRLAITPPRTAAGRPVTKAKSCTTTIALSSQLNLATSSRRMLAAAGQVLGARSTVNQASKVVTDNRRKAKHRSLTPRASGREVKYRSDKGGPGIRGYHPRRGRGG